MASKSMALEPKVKRRQWAGLLLVPLAVLWLLWGPVPAGMTGEMRAMAALTVTMALLWVCESIPLAATALLPLVFLPLTGVSEPAEAAQAYAGDIVFLFIGGFILANGVRHWGLHRRVAGRILRLAGSNKSQLVGWMMAMTAFISLWISNTATALLMMPVGLSLLQDESGETVTTDQERCELDVEEGNFGACLVLGIATAASIGGMGTPIGSTPNLLFINVVERLHGINVSFVQWMTMGIPLVVLFTFCSWLLLTRVLFPLKAYGSFGEQPERTWQREPNPVSFGEILVGTIFSLTALGWVFREERTIAGWRFGLETLFPHISDGTIAIAGAVALFGIPVSLRPLRFALDWETGGKLPWDVVLLLGGGLSLADGIAFSHLDRFLVEKLSGLNGVPGWSAVLMVCLCCVLLSEVASNTAIAALLIPLVGSLATVLGYHPLFLMLPAALATSLGFMLPVATPPNALALATGRVTVTQMARTGFILNVLGLLLILIVLYLLGFRAFGVRPDTAPLPIRQMS